jgi:hypothetical protein
VAVLIPYGFVTMQRFKGGGIRQRIRNCWSRVTPKFLRRSPTPVYRGAWKIDKMRDRRGERKSKDEADTAHQVGTYVRGVPGSESTQKVEKAHTG